METFLARNRGKRTNLIILGAGYDTRCYRLPGMEHTNKYEVDAPGTQGHKRRLIREIGIRPSNTTFVTCNFTEEDWMDCLLEHSLDPSLPTFIVWEGVTYYLPREVIRDTLTKVASSFSPGSLLAFDYFNDWARDPQIQDAMKRMGEPLRGVLEFHEMIADVEAAGLVLRDHLEGGEELGERYLVKRWNGRAAGYVGDFGGFVLAGKQ